MNLFAIKSKNNKIVLFLILVISINW